MASIPQVTPKLPVSAAIETRVRYRSSSRERRPSYACPRCFSSQVLAEPVENPWDWLVSRLGIKNMYCRQCSHTFIWL